MVASTEVFKGDDNIRPPGFGLPLHGPQHESSDHNRHLAAPSPDVNLRNTCPASPGTSTMPALSEPTFGYLALDF